ncbi:MAG: NAD(P)H-dependent glycerol-3-phosphate dehydrogenase [Alphaproteobacteria bacterium]
MEIGIIGAGAWGTAIAEVMAYAQNDVTLWAIEEEVVNHINSKHENNLYLKGVKLSSSIKATNNLEDMALKEVIFLAMPAQHLRGICQKLIDIIGKNCFLAICAKGIEEKSGLLLSDIAALEFPKNPIGILSGPTFAKEVALKMPTAITLATHDVNLGKHLIQNMVTPWFRPYLSDDVIGCQIGGAVKNVLAIACGIVEGKKMGDNTRAALITRGLAEILRLALALGARTETLMGLSGMGDLILTASSMQSRNFSLGFELGKGKKLNEILSSRNSVAEGVYTASAVCQKAKGLGVEMPISQGINDIINYGKDVDEVIKGLLERPLKKEF